MRLPILPKISFLQSDPSLASPKNSEKMNSGHCKDVNFELRRGECLGLLGRNGAGKSTLVRILSGILKQDYGSFEVNGSIGGIIALGAGFNPVLTGRENLKVYAAIKGISQKILRQKEEEIIEFSEIGNFIDSPFRTYSSGMQVRLAFQQPPFCMSQMFCLSMRYWRWET